MNDEREFISLERAVSMLPDGEDVHTFRQGGPALIGADWDRNALIKHLSKHADKIELSGEMATSMKHGIAVIDEHGPLFIATRQEA